MYLTETSQLWGKNGYIWGLLGKKTLHWFLIITDDIIIWLKGYTIQRIQILWILKIKRTF